MLDLSRWQVIEIGLLFGLGFGIGESFVVWLFTILTRIRRSNVRGG